MDSSSFTPVAGQETPRSRGCSRVLFITFDAVGARLGGSAIRVIELARALAAAGHAPTVATAALVPGGGAQPFPLCAFDLDRPRASLRPLLAQAEVVVLPPHGLVRLPFLAGLRVPLVFDLYDPLLLELLEVGKDRPCAARAREVRAHTAILNHALRRGDFFLCASERQRDLWLGALAANGRLVPQPGMDASFRRLIDVVPFGLSPSPPAAAERGPVGRPALTALVPAVGGAEAVLVWGGGIWDWLDPLTPVRAMAVLASRRPAVHLVLFAGPHPTAGPAGASVGAGARQLAACAVPGGLAGRQVHFLDDYVAYAERGRYLCECDAGVSTHSQHLESRFAFRTRILDYLWAGLPVVCTEGDVLADLVAADGLGIVVPAHDVEALAGAFERVAVDADFVRACRARIGANRHRFAWGAAVEPLVRFSAAPRATTRHAATSGSLSAAWGLAASAWRVLGSHGTREAVRRLHRHFFLRS